MAKIYLDADTDTVYIERGSMYLVISPDGVPTEVHRLPGAAAEMISEDDIDTTGAWSDGYDEGRDAGYDDGYSDAQSDTDTAYDEGYRAGYDARTEEMEQE